VIYGKRKFIAIISDTREQAEEFLEIIKDELLDNELLKEANAEACGKGSIWKAGRIIKTGSKLSAGAKANACAEHVLNIPGQIWSFATI
jgi:hypothetical protein